MAKKNQIREKEESLVDRLDRGEIEFRTSGGRAIDLNLVHQALNNAGEYGPIDREKALKDWASSDGWLVVGKSAYDNKPCTCGAATRCNLNY